MKNSVKKTVLALFAVLPALAVLGGCDLLFGKLEGPDPLAGELGLLSVTIAGAEAASGANGRTMLAIDPEFSRYELTVSPNPETVNDSGSSKSYFSETGSFEITLPARSYAISAAGYTGDKPSARTWDNAERRLATRNVSITSGNQTPASLTVIPYMDDETYGALRYSLNWDTVGQIPVQAELLIEQYDRDGDAWDGIPISFITGDAAAGSRRGAVLLLQRSAGLVAQTGVLDLPPGEYRLTTTVVMDGPWPPVSRSDIAHVYSNLTTPAAFFYGAGDLIVTNPGLDSSAGFITKFNFTQTPGATSIVGSAPGPDGTRLIMVMVPTDTNLTHLTPVVECVPGARVISPAPGFVDPDGNPYWDSGDYSKPTRWIAEGVNGATQEYTVVVTPAAAGDCLITNIAFDEVALISAPLIDQSARSITVVVPYGTRAANSNYNLTPVFSYVGREVKFAASSDAGEDTPLAKIVFMNNGTPARNFRVYAQNGATKLYTVMILEAASGEAEITDFVFDGYPDYPGAINQTTGAITVELPYGASLASLKPLITYKGRLSPGSGVEQNFNVLVNYTVTSENGSLVKTYPVTVTTKPADSDTGIFDFVITNVPRAKVVIGTKPRSDGKIPIVVQVPYATSPLITPTPDDGPRTDLKALIPKITLSSSNSKITFPSSYADGQVLPFNDQHDYQEAVYTITAQGGNTQDYVVVVARDVHYYYVKATGDDTDPDEYNGGSESTPFKTLAHAVYQAVKHNVDHIYVIGTLTDTSEGGASEDTSTTAAGDSGTFNSSGGASIVNGGGASVFNLKGAGLDGETPRRIYITGVGSNAILQGTSGKRVISITGGAHITFENIAIQGGGGSSYAGNGGGIYVGKDDSKVVWKSGVITGNTAKSGGGVYLDGVANDTFDDDSEFDFMTGSINNNTASDTSITRAHFDNNTITAASISGGGGVYIYGDALFWMNSGEIANNTAAGSAGGVLVNGSTVPDSPGYEDMPNNFLMSGGSINTNKSNSSIRPGGGGGVYLAKGVFQMLNGEITLNNSNRQGGGVFVWSRAFFIMDGNSSVTANSGVGSSKAICNRGITTMRGNSRADAVYIWNFAKPPLTGVSGSWNNGNGDEFTLMGGARISGVALAFADDPQPRNGRNYINIMEDGGQFFTGADLVATVDLESHLNDDGSFNQSATVKGDWIDVPNTYIIKNGGLPIPADQIAVLKRFTLGTFTYGKSPAITLKNLYELSNTGQLKSK
jgi:hypothetical protein